MADETQNLVHNEIPEPSVLDNGERQSRSLTCNKNTAMSLLSVFVALLIAGQAISVYFITQQQSSIKYLSDTATELKLKDMVRNLPGSPQNRNRPKLRMASANIPLAFSDADGSPQNLEAIAEKSKTVEDAVKYMLLRTNPLRTYPSLNGTVLENLRKLKRTLTDQEWMVFDAWMQQWYLFYLVQHTETAKTAPEPTGKGVNSLVKTAEPPKKAPEPTGFRMILNPWKKDQRTAGIRRNLVYGTTTYSTDTETSVIDESPSGASMVSECMEKASTPTLPGAYVPQCDENGDYSSKQCWRSTGYCWCVTKNGTEIPGTRSRAKIDCQNIENVVTENYK